MILLFCNQQPNRVKTVDKSDQIEYIVFSASASSVNGAEYMRRRKSCRRFS